MKKVVATGVFNILHPGHLLFLREAKKLGDKLTVIVATDNIAGKRKGNTLIPEKQRLEVIKSLKMVDEAILGDDEDIFRPILDIRPDIIALGKDQKFDEEELEKELKNRGMDTRVIRIEQYLEGNLNSSKRIVEKIRSF